MLTSGLSTVTTTSTATEAVPSATSASKADPVSGLEGALGTSAVDVQALAFKIYALLFSHHRFRCLGIRKHHVSKTRKRNICFLFTRHNCQKL
jgi:hypothetical protein